MNKKLIALSIALGSFGIASATTYTVEAWHNLTVQVGGPRQGANGIRFMNVEGSANGNFASYAVMEFKPSELGAVSVSSLTGLKFWLRASNAAFSVDANLNVYISRDNATNINQAQNSPVVGLPKSPLIFDNTFLEEGLGTQLSPVNNVGQVQYHVADGTGFYYKVNLTPDTSTLNYVKGQLNAGLPVRVVVTPSSPSDAGTFTGFDHQTGNPLMPTLGPTLQFETNGTDSSFMGSVKLPGYTGDWSKETVSITIEDPDSGTVVDQIDGIRLSNRGAYSFSTAFNGGYNVFVKSPKFLRKKIGAALSTNQVFDLVELTNGDCDNDNVVSIFDYILMSDTFDKAEGDAGYDSRGDLDGDGVISIFDYIIMSDNFDKAGE